MPIREYLCVECEFITETFKEEKTSKRKCKECGEDAILLISASADTGWRYPTSKN